MPLSPHSHSAGQSSAAPLHGDTAAIRTRHMFGPATVVSHGLRRFWRRRMAIMGILWALLVGSDRVQRTGQIGALPNLRNLPADAFQAEAVDGCPQTLASDRPVVGRTIRARHLSPPLADLLTSLFVHPRTAFRACHVRRSAHPASNHSTISCRLHRTLPPILTGLGSLPLAFSRQICRSDTRSICANSRAEMARAVSRSRHLHCCLG